MSVRFPYVDTVKPDVVGLSARRASTYETPYGFACSQVLDLAALAVRAREMATKIGVDPRAQMAIETLLRWKLSEHAPREFVVLDHRSLAGDSASVGDGVLLVVACQIVPANEAYRTYRELFTAQPVAAATGTIVPTERAPSSTPTARQRIAALDSHYGHSAADTLYASCAGAYPTTLDSIIAAVSTPAPIDLSDDDNDTMLVDRNASRPSYTEYVDTARLEWYRSVLRSPKTRVRIVVRGYANRAAVGAAPRVSYADNSNHLYVVDGSRVYSSIERAEEIVDSPPPPIERLPSSTLPPIDGSASIEQSRTTPPTTFHLLDRLNALSLSRLTYYEVNRAARHRFNLHSSLYSYWHAQLPLEYVKMISYPRGYEAPSRQRFQNAPGLLASAKYQDYAAIGLAALCMLAAINEAFHHWLLTAEAYYYKSIVHDVDPTPYVERIEAFITTCVPPSSGALRRLLDKIESDALRKIAELDKLADDANTNDDDDDDNSLSPQTDDASALHADASDDTVEPPIFDSEIGQ